MYSKAPVQLRQMTKKASRTQQNMKVLSNHDLDIIQNFSQCNICPCWFQLLVSVIPYCIFEQHFISSLHSSLPCFHPSLISSMYSAKNIKNLITWGSPLSLPTYTVANRPNSSFRSKEGFFPPFFYSCQWPNIFFCFYFNVFVPTGNTNSGW